MPGPKLRSMPLQMLMERAKSLRAQRYMKGWLSRRQVLYLKDLKGELKRRNFKAW